MGWRVMSRACVVVALVFGGACGGPDPPPPSVDGGGGDRPPADRDSGATVDARPDAAPDTTTVPEAPGDPPPADTRDVAVDAAAPDSADRPADSPADMNAADSAPDASDSPADRPADDVAVEGPTGPVSCMSDRDCPGGHYCRFSVNSCGVCRIPPCLCVARPTTCEPPAAGFACGCDRRIYCSHCAMARAGVNESMAGTCSGFVGPCIQ